MIEPHVFFECTRDIGDRPQTTKPATNSSSNSGVTIESVLSKLKSGNLDSALKDLDTLKCGSTVTKKDGGYTVEFSYNGADYTITYYGNVDNNDTSGEKTPPSNSQGTPQPVGNPQLPKTDNNSNDEGNVGEEEEKDDNNNSDGTNDGDLSIPGRRHPDLIEAPDIELPRISDTDDVDNDGNKSKNNGSSREINTSVHTFINQPNPTGGENDSSTDNGSTKSASSADSSAEETKGTESKDSDAVAETSVSDAAGRIIGALTLVTDDSIDDILADFRTSTYGHYFYTSMHTEFGIDSNGNIVFQEDSTQKAFDNIFNELKKKIESLEAFVNIKGTIENLGGNDVLKKLIQAAWITAYNDFNSSTTNNSEEFVKKVLENLNNLLQKIRTDSTIMEILTQHTAYGDSTLTDGVTHYDTDTTAGGDERIAYGEAWIDADGTVQMDTNAKDNEDYKTTMSEILEKLYTKYPSIDKNKIAELFKQAQQNALNTACNNIKDCPYGTGNNGSRVEDSTKNWGGKDSRKKDKGRIDMDELVQLTLYNFDKLLYNYLMTKS